MQGFEMVLRAMGVDPKKMQEQAAEVGKVLDEVRGRFDAIHGMSAQILQNQAEQAARLTSIETFLAAQGFVPAHHADVLTGGTGPAPAPAADPAPAPAASAA